MTINHSTSFFPVPRLPQIFCASHPAAPSRVSSHAAAWFQLRHMREMVPDTFRISAPRANPYWRAPFPVRGLPKELRPEGNSVPALDDAHRTETVQLPTLPEGVHSEGTVEGSFKVAHESESIRYSVALLHIVSEGVLSRIGIKQALGNAHRENVQVQRLRQVIY